ncbi:SAG family member [Eimeria mitis]|uniref:SAG family member n=1 Tax=Eimeria mitis TaxID=44415 RepID=U6K3S6_9EIME|nr:SAG family member [Eimeria mitis]CDJ32329.1 SAG family member [Eimeria mitis]
MGPVFKGAAVVCLVALSGLQPAAGALEFSAKKADEDAYTSVNLARVGQMSVRIGVLTEDSDLAEGLNAKLPATASDSSPAETCDKSIETLKKTKFVAQFTDAQDLNYRQAVQKALDAGLGHMESYPDTEQKWTDFWKQADGANLAHLLWTNSTKVGCAVGTCTEGDQNRTPETSITFLFCEMEPAAVENKAPFDTLSMRSKHPAGWCVRYYTALLQKFQADNLQEVPSLADFVSMVSFYKTAAAVCLVVVCGPQSGVAGDAYLAAKLARNGKLPVHITEVSEDENTVTTLTNTVNDATAGDDATCKKLVESHLKETFHRAFEYKADTTPNYHELLQAALNDGLAVFEKEGPMNGLRPKHPPQLWFCFLGLSFCLFFLLFSEEYFNGLIERTTLLKDMTADDLKLSVGNGAEAAAVPTILIAGLVAMLAVVSS